MILQIWKNENLSPRAKSSHKKWLANLQAEHVDIVQRFQRRMRDLHKDRRRADRADAASRDNANGGRGALRDAAVAAALS